MDLFAFKCFWQKFPGYPPQFNSQFHLRRENTKPFELSHWADHNNHSTFPINSVLLPLVRVSVLGMKAVVFKAPHGAKHGGWDQGKFYLIQTWQFLVRFSYFYWLSVLLVAAIFSLLAQFQKKLIVTVLPLRSKLFCRNRILEFPAQPFSLMSLCHLTLVYRLLLTIHLTLNLS